MAQSFGISLQKVTELPLPEVKIVLPELAPLPQELKQNVRSTIRQKAIQRQNDTDIESKYKTLTNAYMGFINLMKNTSLADTNTEHVAQPVFVAIDNLSRAILDFPQPTKNFYTDLITSYRYRFAYQGYAEMSLEDLFDLAKDYVYVHNSSIEQLLSLQLPKDVHNNYVKSKKDEEFLKLVNSSIKELNNPPVYKQINEAAEELQSFLKDESLNNQSNKVKAQKEFIVIDNLAKAILNLPQEEQANYIEYYSQTFPLKDMLNSVKDYIYVKDSAIEQIVFMNEENIKQNKGAKQPQKSSWWQGFIETMQREK